MIAGKIISNVWLHYKYYFESIPRAIRNSGEIGAEHAFCNNGKDQRRGANPWASPRNRRVRRLANFKAATDQFATTLKTVVDEIGKEAQRFYETHFSGGDPASVRLEAKFVAEGIHVVSLNRARAFGQHADWSESRLWKCQLQRMEFQFANGKPALRVLMLHHPLPAPEGHGRAVVDPLPDLIESS